MASIGQGLNHRNQTFAQVQPKKYGLRSAGKRAPLSSIGNVGRTSVKAAKTSASSFPTIPSSYGGENEDYTMMSVDEPVNARPKNVPDIDADRSDPQLVGEYAQQIHRYMQQHENKLVAAENYMQSQTMITPTMRGILLDWLVEVHLRFELLPETLFLTTMLIDRFLSKVSVSRSKLQLVGVTAMLLASKYEEMWPPEVLDFVYMTDNAYKAQQILEMELTMLEALDYNLGNPIHTQFLERYMAATSDTGSNVEKFARFVMETSIISYDLVKFKASEIAAASLIIGRRITGNSKRSESLEFYSNHTYEHLQPCIDALHSSLKACMNPEESRKAIRRKYRLEKYDFLSQRTELAAYVGKL